MMEGWVLKEPSNKGRIQIHIKKIYITIEQNFYWICMNLLAVRKGKPSVLTRNNEKNSAWLKN